MNDARITIKAANTAAEIEQLRPFLATFHLHPEADADFVLMLGSVRREILRPLCLVAYDGAKPVAAMMGRVETTVIRPKIGYLKLFGLPMRQLVFVRDGFVGEQSPEVAQRMVEEILKLLKQGVADRAFLDSISISSALNDATRTDCPILQRDYARHLNQHWKTRLPATLEAFLAKRPKKHRYWLKRITRVFEAEYPGKVRYAIFQKEDELDTFCKAAELVAQTTYQRGLGAGFIDNEENRKRVGLMARKGWFRAYVVFLDEKPIAFWAGELIKEVMHLTWTGFDPAHRKFEVGTILFLKMIEDLVGQGVTQMDYGLGWAQYKERFGDECLEEQSVAVYASSVKSCGINLICTVEAMVNRTGKRLVAGLKMRERIKKMWRFLLASKAAPVPQPAAAVPAREPELELEKNA